MEMMQLDNLFIIVSPSFRQIIKWVISYCFALKTVIPFAMSAYFC